MTEVIVSGAFDDMHSTQMRFLEEAAKLGRVTLLLWSDPTVQALTGRAAAFPAIERRYFLESVRYVDRVVELACAVEQGGLAAFPGLQPDAWVVRAGEDTPARRSWCEAHSIRCQAIPLAGLEQFPPPPEIDRTRRPGRKKVVVSGCYDWLHSGHVRFFEEASEFGELYVVVGNDLNVRNLKGEGHPLFPQDLRRYMVGAIRYVHQALITSGWGWLDYEPDIEKIQPDIFLVNEDGDRPEKRALCAARGLEYVVLIRLPKAGLSPRTSTDLRGF